MILRVALLICCCNSHREETRRDGDYFFLCVCKLKSFFLMYSNDLFILLNHKNIFFSITSNSATVGVRYITEIGIVELGFRTLGAILARLW